jgi:hypothetical protein
VPPLYPEFISEDICLGQNAFIQYTGTAGDTLSYSWDFDGGTIISGSEEGPYVINWNNVGPKEVTVTISHEFFTESYTDIITVKPIPNTIFTTDTILCAGQTLTITYTGNASDTANFDWNFGSASVLSGYGIGPYEITWYNFGNFSISLNSVNENGCTSEYPTVLPIYVPMTVTIDNINITPSSCYGTCDAIAEVLCSGGVAPYSYSWFNDSITTDSSSLGNFCAGKYYVTVTDVNQCMIKDSFIVTQPLPVNISSFINHVSCHDYQDGSIQIIAYNGEPPYSFEWHDGMYGNVRENIYSGNYFLNNFRQ